MVRILGLGLSDPGSSPGLGIINIKFISKQFNSFRLNLQLRHFLKKQYLSTNLC